MQGNLLDFLESGISDECGSFVKSHPDWKQAASRIRYYDTTFAPWGEMPIGSVVPYLDTVPSADPANPRPASQFTLAEYVGAATAAVVAGWADGEWTFSRVVVLSMSFFDRGMPVTTQVHEYLHILTQLGDTDLADRLGLGKDLSSSQASGAIRDYIQEKCPKKQ